jgi:hypothetical protein
METTKISIINFPNPQAIEEIAKWDTLFNSATLDDSANAPLIREHSLPNGVGALQAIMSASYKKFDPLWEPFTQEELIEGARTYWANLDEPGLFDMRKSLLTINMACCATQRPLTRCELILVMKCNYLAKFRMQALLNGFDPSKQMWPDSNGFSKTCETCICSHIPFQ